jgi:hypothetical protein
MEGPASSIATEVPTISDTPLGSVFLMMRCTIDARSGSKGAAELRDCRRQVLLNNRTSTARLLILAPLVQKSRFLHQFQALDYFQLFCCINPVQNHPMIHGYARVSTDGQSVDAQVKQLRAAGAGKVYRDTASGAKTERVQLRRVLNLRIPATYS